KIPDAIFQQIPKEFGKDIALLKSEADLAYSGPRHFQLAAALNAYVKAKGHYPRGTVEQQPQDDGTYPVDAPMNRLSWGIALLPYLSYEKVDVDPQSPWSTGKNLRVAQMIVPHYIVRSKGTAGYTTSTPTVRKEVGASHWVGMAGVGPEAARYPASDDRAGIFGYDRVTQAKDIPPARLDKIIALIQVPADRVAPWIAGGGATVRGVSDEEKDNPLEPFLSTFERNGE